LTIVTRRRPLDHVQALQAESLGFLLVRAGQLWSERVVALVNADAGAPVVREAHTRLFPHLLAEGGLRITELAKAVGVTKQAVQPLVAELAELGMVRVEADPLDARARRVLLTDHGVAAMVHGTGVLLRVEAEVTPRLAAREVKELKRLLGKLLPILEHTLAQRQEQPEQRLAKAQPPSATARGGATSARRATSSRARRGPGRRA
jgi:DNA-binding MarR family transcriptional regulator